MILNRNILFLILFGSSKNGLNNSDKYIRAYHFVEMYEKDNSSKEFEKKYSPTTKLLKCNLVDQIEKFLTLYLCQFLTKTTVFFTTGKQDAGEIYLDQVFRYLASVEQQEFLFTILSLLFTKKSIITDQIKSQDKISIKLLLKNRYDLPAFLFIKSNRVFVSNNSLQFFQMNIKNIIDKEQKPSYCAKSIKSQLTKQNIEKILKIITQYDLQNKRHLPIQLLISYLDDNVKLLQRIIHFQNISQNARKVKTILMQLLLKPDIYMHRDFKNTQFSSQRGEKINQLIIQKSFSSEPPLDCICCSKIAIEGKNSHFLPFYCSIQELKNNEYPEYLNCQLKYARIMCSLLNEGQGCIIIGLKLDDSFSKAMSTKIKIYFTKFITLINKNKSKQARKFATRYFNELKKYIGVEKSNQEETFNVVVQYISVMNAEKNQQIENNTQYDCSYSTQESNYEQKYLIRVKVKALFKQKIYHVKRMYEQRQMPQYWIRNISGDMCQITGPNIYKFAKQIYKFEKNMKCFTDHKIKNEFNEIQAQNRILVAQKYSHKYQFIKENLRPQFLSESCISFILVIGSHKQLYLFDKLKGLMKEKRIVFVQSEPFIKYKGIIYQRYWIFSVLLTEQQLNHFISQNFKWYKNKFCKVQNFIEVKIKKEQYLSPRIISNIERLLNLQKINNKIIVKEEQNNCILQFSSSVSCIFAFIYLKSRQIRVEFSKLVNNHLIKQEQKQNRPPQH